MQTRTGVFSLVLTIGSLLSIILFLSNTQTASADEFIIVVPTPDHIELGWNLSFWVDNDHVVGQEELLIYQIMTDDSKQLLISQIYEIPCDTVGGVEYIENTAYFHGNGFVACNDLDLLAEFRDLSQQADPPVTIPICSELPSNCPIGASGVGAWANVHTPPNSVNPVIAYKHIRLSENSTPSFTTVTWEIADTQSSYDIDNMSWHWTIVAQNCIYNWGSCSYDFDFYMNNLYRGSGPGSQYYYFNSDSMPIFIGLDPDTWTISTGAFRAAYLDPTAICAGCGM